MGVLKTGFRHHPIDVSFFFRLFFSRSFFFAVLLFLHSFFFPRTFLPRHKMASNGAPFSSAGSDNVNAESQAVGGVGGVGSVGGGVGGVSAQDSQAVVRLSLVDGDFNPQMKRGETTFVKFFAPWCGHCKTLAPTWELPSTKFANKVKVAEVDCTKNQALCQRFRIDGYPTLMLFKDGQPVEQYSGGRDIKTLSNYLEKKM